MLLFSSQWNITPLGNPLQRGLPICLNQSKLEITKNKQYKDAGPVWVQWGEYAGLWQSSSLQGKSLSEKLDILTPFLQTSLAFLPDLAGVILSPGKGALGNTPIEPLDTPIERNGGIAIRCLMPETNQKRESIIVIRAGEFTEQARIFTDLYQQENRWLDWALKKLGKLSFDELVHLSEQARDPIGSSAVAEPPSGKELRQTCCEN